MSEPKKGAGMTRLTKEQYELLEGFGVGSIDPYTVHVPGLQAAIRAAINIIPFRSVDGMEDYAPPEVAALKQPRTQITRKEVETIVFPKVSREHNYNTVTAAITRLRELGVEVEP